MSRKLTLSGGPLDGKTYLVPEAAAALVHHAAHGGYYGTDGHWNADVVVDLLPDLSAFTAALSSGAAAPADGLDEFLPKGLPRVIAEARLGRRVIVVGRTIELADHAFSELADLADDAVSVTRSNGREVIRFASGGVVTITSPQSRRARGRTADVLYLLPEVTEADVTDLLPALATSNVALVLHHQQG